jgi:Dipeptidyl peptidase IV (DPP IV) N-terminal region
LFDVRPRRELFPLTATPDDPTHPYLLHAAWTPKLGHALVIVFNYDIYYRPGPRGNAVYRLTEDAVPGVVSNGVPDWVYEGKYNMLYFLKVWDINTKIGVDNLKTYKTLKIGDEHAK